MAPVDYVVRRIRPGEGGRLKEVRLRALADAPRAFASTFEAESNRPDGYWDDLARRRSEGTADATFLAEAGPQGPSASGVHVDCP